MNMKEKMLSGDIYYPNDDNIMKEQLERLDVLYDFNNTRPSQLELRDNLLHKMFASIGSNCYIEPPLHANWAGANVYMGNNVYANFNLTLVDDAKITIGDNVMFGPNVVLATGSHPILPELRLKGLQFNKEIHIGSNCWLGAGVIVLPGVNIGDNTVIGAGSVVTKDIPSDVVAVGNPCKVLRKISQRDKIYFYKNETINYDEIKEMIKK